MGGLSETRLTTDQNLKALEIDVDGSCWEGVDVVSSGRVVMTNQRDVRGRGCGTGFKLS